jgi:hypothetical protein
MDFSAEIFQVRRVGKYTTSAERKKVTKLLTTSGFSEKAALQKQKRAITFPRQTQTESSLLTIQ